MLTFIVRDCFVPHDVWGTARVILQRELDALADEPALVGVQILRNNTYNNAGTEFILIATLNTEKVRGQP